MTARPLDTYADIHSHMMSKALDGTTLVSAEPDDRLLPEGHYSLGIHPWHSAGISCTLLRRLVATARLPQVKAIGEAGIDRLKGADPDAQIRLFVFHARLARQLGKPLIIHCVRAWDILLQCARALRPAPGTWIVHGFRGKPALARQLLDAGLALSFGRRYNPESMAATPSSRMYRETDRQPSNPTSQNTE